MEAGAPYEPMYGASVGHCICLAEGLYGDALSPESCVPQVCEPQVQEPLQVCKPGAQSLRKPQGREPCQVRGLRRR